MYLCVCVCVCVCVRVCVRACVRAPVCVRVRARRPRLFSCKLVAWHKCGGYIGGVFINRNAAVDSKLDFSCSCSYKDMSCVLHLDNRPTCTK